MMQFRNSRASGRQVIGGCTLKTARKFGRFAMRRVMHTVQPLCGEIVEAMEEAVTAGRTPGAVCLIGRGDETLCHEAVGRRALAPQPQPMLPDTLFDVASLTKVVATTTVVMQLVERRVLALDDPVTRWLPDFRGGDSDRVTLRHLLAHSSGLPAHVNYADVLGEEVAPRDRQCRVIEEICRLAVAYGPDESAIYSCLGFILLAGIIERAAGRSVAELASDEVFAPLRMTETGFCPPAGSIGLCAATEKLNGAPLVGVVHDENARYLGGISGNAGLFSTAPDLARFAGALLAGGQLDGARILRPESVERIFMEEPTRGGLRRCLGWRMPDSGDIHLHGAPSARSVGHTGYTGTSLWIDREADLFVILLTNRVHLGRDADIEPLRREVGEIAAQLTGVQM